RSYLSSWSCWPPLVPALRPYLKVWRAIRRGGRRLLLRHPTAPSIRADKEERGRHQRQQDRTHQARARQEEGQPHDGAGRHRQFGRVPDEEVPPEVAEGPDQPGNYRHRGAVIRGAVIVAPSRVAPSFVTSSRGRRLSDRDREPR